MKPTNYLWAGIALLMLLCSVSAMAQTQVKNAGIRYFNGVPTTAPALATGGEVAIDTTTGYLYMWQRDAAAWSRVYLFDRLAGTSAPGYVPSDKQSIFVVNDADSMYMYRSGAWRHLNKATTDSNWSNSSNTATGNYTQSGPNRVLILRDYYAIMQNAAVIVLRNSLTGTNGGVVNLDSTGYAALTASSAEYGMAGFEAYSKYDGVLRNEARITGDTVLLNSENPALQWKTTAGRFGIRAHDNADYTLKLPETAGTAGQVLSTDGSGVTDWIDAGGGGVSDGTYGDIVVSGGGTVWDIAADAVTSAEIASGAVGTTEIATGAVTSTDLATDAVTASKINAGAVTNAKLGAASVTMDKIDQSSATNGQVITWIGSAWSPASPMSISDYNYLTAYGSGVSGSNIYDYTFDSLATFTVGIGGAYSSGANGMQLTSIGIDQWKKGNANISLYSNERAEMRSNGSGVLVYKDTVTLTSNKLVSIQTDTIQINTLKYTFPTAHAEGLLYNDGSGALRVAPADTLTTNEGALSVSAATDSTANIATNTSGDGGVYLKEGRGIELTETADTITITVPTYDRVLLFQAVSASTTLSTSGVTLSTSGTASAIASAVTDIRTRRQRVRYTTTAATNQQAGVGSSSNIMSVQGGFTYESVFYFSTTSANARGFAGVSSNMALSVNPRGINTTNVAGFAFNDTDTNWFFVYNDGSGSTASFDLGVAKNTSGSVWKAEVWGDATAISYRLTDLATGSAVSGKITSNIPIAASLIRPHCLYGTGNGTTAVEIDFSHMIVRTQY